jgi:hypothetical protein
MNLFEYFEKSETNQTINLNSILLTKNKKIIDNFIENFFFSLYFSLPFLLSSNLFNSFFYFLTFLIFLFNFFLVLLENKENLLFFQFFKNQLKFFWVCLVLSIFFNTLLVYLQPKFDEFVILYKDNNINPLFLSGEKIEIVLFRKESKIIEKYHVKFPEVMSFRKICDWMVTDNFFIQQVDLNRYLDIKIKDISCFDYLKKYKKIK